MCLLYTSDKLSVLSVSCGSTSRILWEGEVSTTLGPRDVCSKRCFWLKPYSLKEHPCTNLQQTHVAAAVHRWIVFGEITQSLCTPAFVRGMNVKLDIGTSFANVCELRHQGPRWKAGRMGSIGPMSVLTGVRTSQNSKPQSVGR